MARCYDRTGRPAGGQLPLAQVSAHGAMSDTAWTDLAVVVAFTLAALGAGADTLRRRTVWPSVASDLGKRAAGPRSAHARDHHAADGHPLHRVQHLAE